MIDIRKLLFFALFVIPFFVHAESVNIHGTASEFANEQLSVITFSDQITYAETILAECEIDENGNFSFEFKIEETKYIFLRLGVYEAFLFVEPGKEYELILPKRKDRTVADKLNPYFEPTQYHLGIKNTSEQELNFQLAFFDEIYSGLINNNLQLTYSELKKKNAKSKLNKVDTVFSDKAYTRAVDNNSYAVFNNLKDFDATSEVAKIDSFFSGSVNSFFNDFKKFKLASFLYLSFNKKAKSISNTYYLNNELLYYNPAYMGLFNQVYKDYFQYFGRTEKGGKIYSDINKHGSYSMLSETLNQDSILTNQALKELVILKCLHDEFYNDKFSRSGMLKVLDSLALETDINEHKLIAKNIRDKVTKLLVGYKPPAFELFDKDSNLVSLETFQDKYVYLGFCTTISYGCIKEFEMLRTLYEKHKNHFEIVMVCMDESFEQMKHFVERKKYPFTFLYYGNQSDVFKQYDIRAFPTYYFINKEGKLSMSPAASPAENIEYKIFQQMRSNKDI